MVRELRKANGTVVSSREDILDTYHDFYENLYGAEPIEMEDKAYFLDQLENRLREEDSSNLDWPLSLEEMERALKEICRTRTQSRDWPEIWKAILNPLLTNWERLVCWNLAHDGLVTNQKLHSWRRDNDKIHDLRLPGGTEVKLSQYADDNAGVLVDDDYFKHFVEDVSTYDKVTAVFLAPYLSYGRRSVEADRLLRRTRGVRYGVTLTGDLAGLPAVTEFPFRQVGEQNLKADISAPGISSPGEGAEVVTGSLPPLEGEDKILEEDDEAAADA
ncbi:Hypp777 [Branchiostoma lanceolatum]|uniref:Hypp777 protein n=1 Tax=Branchiostoma lanceolatum TaxID=7740 RepID=A0A8J9VCA0_BRALA|nr:Hypp777 [Branchiostoma lanceolatum]